MTVGSLIESVVVGQQVTERKGDGLEERFRGVSGKSWGWETKNSSKRQSSQEMEMGWEKGLRQAGCYRTNNEDRKDGDNHLSPSPVWTMEISDIGS